MNIYNSMTLIMLIVSKHVYKMGIFAWQNFPFISLFLCSLVCTNDYIKYRNSDTSQCFAYK